MNNSQKSVNDILKLIHVTEYFAFNPLLRDCLLILIRVVLKCQNLICCIAESVLMMDLINGGNNLDRKKGLLKTVWHYL